MHALSIAIKQPMKPGILPFRASAEEPRLEWEDSAVLAVTDFTREFPVTVEEERSIDDALNDMVRLGVRALVVTRNRGIAGLITSYDIQGERPMQFLQSSNYSRHEDIQVGHIMTPWEHLSSVDWRDLPNVTVGQLTAVFEHTQTTHLTVVESQPDGVPWIMRGLISRTRLARQLGAGNGPSPQRLADNRPGRFAAR